MAGDREQALMGGVRCDEAARLLPPPPESGSRRIPDLESFLEQLEESSLERLEKLLKAKRRLALKLNNEKKPMDDTDEEIPPRVVMAFVKELEEAYNFYKLKLYLRENFKKRDYERDDIFQCLVEEVESRNTFDNDQAAIWRAVREHITGVRAKTSCQSFAAYLETRIEQKLRLLFGDSDEYTIAQREDVYTRYPGLRNLEPPVEPPVLENLSNPVFKLVYETREKKPAYEMDNDPQVELRKIQKSNPMFYHTHFIYQRQPVNLPKNTITVSNLRPDATIFDVEELLKSCGKTTHYEVERGNRNALMIHITFNKASGAKKALQVESPSIDGKPVLITKFEDAPNRLKPEDMKDPSTDEVLLKYRKLIISLKEEANVVEAVSGGNSAETSATNKPANKPARGGEMVDHKQKQAIGIGDGSGAKHPGKTSAKKRKKKSRMLAVARTQGSVPSANCGDVI